MQKLSLDKIIVSQRKRRLDIGKVQELANSIAEIGLLHPIVVSADNRLVSGYHRLTAVKILGWQDVPVTLFNGDSLECELAEIDENLRRNDLTVLEQSDHLQRYKQILEERGLRAKVGWNGNQYVGSEMVAPPAEDEEVSWLRTTKDIGEEFGFGERSIQYREKISKIDTEVKDKIRNLPLADSTTQLLELARMNVEEQNEVVDLIVSGEANDIKKAKKQIKRQERIQTIVTENKALTSDIGVFPVIYADPPWQYEHSETDSRKIENQYPTMTLKDIKELPVKDITTNDAILFLWATSPKLEEALEVVNSWGFNYRTCMVWDKEVMGMGYYARQQHELLLICTKGNIPTPLPENRPRSIYQEKRGKHSQKPDYFRTMIEEMYPELTRVELFAREKTDKWAAWGNELF